MVDERTHSSSFHDRSGDPWPADPPPKPTAEDKLSGWACRNLESPQQWQQLLKIFRAGTNAATRQTFDEAAKRARTSSYPGAHEEWNEACQFIEGRIRALAKEQPSTEM